MDRLTRFGKVVLLVALVALLLIGAAGCASGNGESELDEALSKAQSENKPVMIDFYADWCNPCQQMDKYTYSDDAVSTLLNDNFIFLKVNVDKSNLDGRYGIKYIPTVVFLSPQGTEIGSRIVGYQPPAQFYQGVQAVLSQWSP